MHLPNSFPFSQFAGLKFWGPARANHWQGHMQSVEPMQCTHVFAGPRNTSSWFILILSSNLTTLTWKISQKVNGGVPNPTAYSVAVYECSDASTAGTMPRRIKCDGYDLWTMSIPSFCICGKNCLDHSCNFYLALKVANLTSIFWRTLSSRTKKLLIKVVDHYKI